VASVEHPARAVAAPADAEAVAVPIEPPVPVVPPEPESSPEAELEAELEPESARPARILPPDPQLDEERRAAEEAAREPAPVVVTPPVAPIPGAPVPDALGLSVFDPLTSPELAVPRGEGDSAADAADPSARSVARLIFSSGEVVDVDRAVVVGRAPEHGRFGGEAQTRLVTVPSPHQEISSTHLEVRPGTGADQGSAVVTDLGSTNGTVVAQPGMHAEDLHPGIPVRLVPGSTIDLGEGVTIQVE
jgi:hypothetical protein